jgi:hypothetical protein
VASCFGAAAVPGGVAMADHVEEVPLCEICKIRPYVSHVALDTEPVALCEECLSAIQCELEDEAGY